MISSQGGKTFLYSHCCLKQIAEFILLGVVILVLSGENPIALFSTLLKGIIGIDMMSGSGLNLRYFGEFLLTSMPIVLTGLSVGFAYRTGLFNIGAEGQLMVGAMASIFVAIMVPLPPIIHAIVCVAVGALAGALWGFVPGLLKSRFNVHEVVICIMMNYIGMYFSNWVLRGLPGSTDSKTVIIDSSASLNSELLSSLTNHSRLNWGILFVILAVFAYWFIIEKTSFGYSLRATGFNKDGAQYAGMKVNRNIVSSMMIAGALSGLAGAIVALGTFNMGRVLAAFENYGFDGIAVALTGACNAIGIVLAGLLFGLLKVIQPLLQASGVPKEIGEIISSSIVLFVAMQYGIRVIMGWMAKRRLEKKQPVTVEPNQSGGES